MERRKKILIGAGTLAGVVALGVGGVTTAFADGSPGATNDDKPLTGSTLTRASEAAIEAAGGGTVTDTEASDDDGAAYEVEIALPDGQEVDVHLDKSFKVLTKETETQDESDKPLTGDTLTKASEAAITAAGGGTVTDTETSDDDGAAYEVEVTLADGQQVDVHLDKSFTVVKKEVETAD